MDDRKDIERRLEIMEKTLVGDLSSQRAGIMQNMLQLMEDVYNQQNGIKPRMDKVERNQIRQAAWIAGAMFVALAVWKVIELKFVK